MTNTKETNHHLLDHAQCCVKYDDVRGSEIRHVISPSQQHLNRDVNTHNPQFCVGFCWCRALCIWRPSGLRSVEATLLSTHNWHCLSER